jgi:TldD protein
MNRRDFIKGATAAGVLAALPWRRASAQGGIPPGGTMASDVKRYLEAFGVTEQDIRAVMGVALSRSGDFCDLFFQSTVTNSVGLEDNVVNRAGCAAEMGVGIRVVKGDQTGYSYCEEISLQAMKAAAATAAAIADGPASPAVPELAVQSLPSFYPAQTPWSEVGVDRKVPLLQRVNDRMRGADPRIIKATVSMVDQASRMLVARSDGRMAADDQPLARFTAACIAEHQGRREQNYFDVSARAGFELFTPALLDRVADEAVRSTLALFDAVKPDGGEMPVVLAAGSSGILLHEAIGHGMEADFNRKKISIFCDKVGKPVARKFVSIVDDGTVAANRGAINVDDEGNDTEKTWLVQDGILTGYLHDRISATHYRVKPTGSGRRQSFRFAPQPRMRNTYMLPGPHSRDEIIASVKKGLYAETFTNGQVLIGGGDFTFYVKSGFLIEDGKLTKPVKDINIIGNGPKVLEQITMVGDDLQFSEGGWTCGKNGQGVPVSMGLPTVLVSSATVGGSNG